VEQHEAFRDAAMCVYPANDVDASSNFDQGETWRHDPGPRSRSPHRRAIK
jgi:hypothetical protein